jgi:hypothetical protein
LGKILKMPETGSGILSNSDPYRSRNKSQNIQKTKIKLSARNSKTKKMFNIWLSVYKS